MCRKDFILGHKNFVDVVKVPSFCELKAPKVAKRLEIKMVNVLKSKTRMLPQAEN